MQPPLQQLRAMPCWRRMALCGVAEMAERQVAGAALQLPQLAAGCVSCSQAVHNLQCISTHAVLHMWCEGGGCFGR
jgi:hypothetical protein